MWWFSCSLDFWSRTVPCLSNEHTGKAYVQGRKGSIHLKQVVNLRTCKKYPWVYKGQMRLLTVTEP